MLLVFLVSRCYIYGSYPLPKFQVTMVNKKKSKKGFSDLGSEDLDLTMFTITDLTLNKEEESNMVYMAIKLKRKVVRVVANDRAGIEAAGTWAPRALGHFLFSKKKEKHPWAVGHSGKCSFPKKQPWALGHSGTSSFPKKKKNTLGQFGTRANARFKKTVMGTRALGHSSTHQKTIQRLSKRLSKDYQKDYL